MVAFMQTSGMSEYEVATALLVDMAVFWVTRQCISVKINQSFGGAYCFHHKRISR
jgi:hypothetical protein